MAFEFAEILPPLGTRFLSDCKHKGQFGTAVLGWKPGVQCASNSRGRSLQARAQRESHVLPGGGVGSRPTRDLTGGVGREILGRTNRKSRNLSPPRQDGWDRPIQIQWKSLSNIPRKTGPSSRLDRIGGKGNNGSPLWRYNRRQSQRRGSGHYRLEIRNVFPARNQCLDPARSECANVPGQRARPRVGSSIEAGDEGFFRRTSHRPNSVACSCTASSHK